MAKEKSDLSRAFSEDGTIKTHVGGQALLEGIMMRGKLNWAVAVRQPDGDIYLEEHDLASGKKRNKWMNLPLLRGCRALIESLILGYKALAISADHAFDFEEEEEKERAAKEARKQRKLEKVRAKELEANVGLRASDEDAFAIDRDNSRVDVIAGEPSNTQERPFSWKDDFGRPGQVIDALGAQRSLNVVVDDDEWFAPFSPHVVCEAPQPRMVSQPLAACEEMSAVSDPGASASAAFVADASTTPASSTPASEPAVPDQVAKGKDDDEGLGKGTIAFSMVLGLAMGIGIFIVVPAFLTNLMVGEYDHNPIAWNIIDGFLRVGVFILYLWLIGRMTDIKRMFMYHGAEHKTIHCFEHGLPLTPENARRFPRLHVRCGTAFLIMVMIIAIFIYSVIPVNALIAAWGVPDGALKLLLVIVVRIVFLPVIAGISYEITVRWAGTHPDNPVVKVILWPGMQMQYLTTNEPDDTQLECAIAAMKLVLYREQTAGIGPQAATTGNEVLLEQPGCPSCFQ